ncbi:MAG: hypothetical protein RMZ41_014000 [Nostoc sp. DedVER02]|uniref:hypothetical protein n=1 Tax=unclassified Nostoc TaxID=2593658 RepID=UPI002AD1D6A1|nr:MULTISPECIES: hypothetical protein [unclassified Nostoc]MDZ7987359.1 hypothetical protein [Nostoc sp. DedVER02]MDZ8116042.1 hypothetical protein [Nostoc sp. DedVER01b]
MMLLVRRTEKTVWAQFCNYGVCFKRWSSSFWFNIFAIAIVLIATLIYLLAFVNAPFSQISSDDYQPILSTLFLNNGMSNSTTLQFSGYRLALLYDFGRWLGVQVIRLLSN